MDDVQDFSALGARPRRSIQRPLRFEDYETNLPGLEARRTEDWVTAPPLVGATYASPPLFEHYGEGPQGYATPMRAGVEEIRRERLLLQQTQERMSAGLADIQTLHASMQQMLTRAENLQYSPSPAVAPARYHPDPVKEEEDWPPPPPPVDFKDEPISSQSPGIDCLDAKLYEFQGLSRESLAAQQIRPKTTRPPVPPPRAQPLTNTSLPPPPPPPESSWRSPLPHGTHSPAVNPELTYKGPRPSIPKLIHRDPGEFARLKMALDNLLPPESSELFKYQVLLDHLHLEEAKLIADAYLHSTTPFSDTMHALNEKLGQPHQLALRRIAAVMDSPRINRGDGAAFERFALQIQSLVGMLKTLGPHGEVELRCGSHVALLLSKLPPEQRAEFRRCMFNRSGETYTLDDLSTWLKYESWCQDFDGLPTPSNTKEKPAAKPLKRSTAVLHSVECPSKSPSNTSSTPRQQPYCAYCDNRAHHLSQCPDIIKLTQEQLAEWIKGAGAMLDPIWQLSAP